MQVGRSNKAYYILRIVLVAAAVSGITGTIIIALAPDLATVDLASSLLGLQAIITVCAEFVMNWRMTRFILNNQINLIELNSSPTTQVIEAINEKKRFKYRLITKLVILLLSDAIVISIEVGALLTISSSELNNLILAITIPLYIPIHIILLCRLLDEFKGNVLASRDNRHSISIDRTQRKSVIVATPILKSRALEASGISESFIEE